MEQYISKSDLLAEIDRRIQFFTEESGNSNSDIVIALFGLKSFIETLEVKDMNSVWHNINDIPNFNNNGISDLIIDSYYGHIYREAHYYTPEKWDTHIGFNTNRQFRWAYEKDLIEV